MLNSEEKTIRKLIILSQLNNALELRERVQVCIDGLMDDLLGMGFEFETVLNFD